MQRVIDATGVFCGQIVVEHAGAALRELVVFGSRARDTASPTSDVDILVVIEPASNAWGAAQNVVERTRLHAAAQPRCTAPLDLWVRTIDQFEEARRVVGCVEYLAATRGRPVYSRTPSRLPLAQRSADEIRRRNVRDLFEDSRRVLGRALRLELGMDPLPAAADAHDASYYAWRAIQHALCAVFAWRQVDTPEKADSLPTFLARLSAADADAARRMQPLARADALTPGVARNVLRDAVFHLGQDAGLRVTLEPLRQWLNRPLYQLADAPPLKN